MDSARLSARVMLGALTVFAMLGSQSGCPAPTADSDSAARDEPGNRAPATNDDLFEAWLARVPDENVIATAILLGESGPPGTIFGIQLHDTRDFAVHFIAVDGDQFVSLLVDESGAPILSQVVRDAGLTLTFFPSGDTLDIVPSASGFRHTFVLQGTTPPTIVSLDVAPGGQVVDAGVSTGAEPNPTYPSGANLVNLRAGLIPESANERCQYVAGAIQKLTSFACNYEDSADIVISATCERIGEILDDLKENGASEEAIDRLQAGLNLVCKGTAIAKEGVKFFKRLTPFGWVCFVLDIGEDLSVATSGKSISEAFCDQFFPEVPGEPPVGGCPPRTCPPGQTQNPVTCQCECPAGMTFDDRFGMCGCITGGGFGFHPGDPVHGCNCPGGRQNNADTGACECPSGRTENPITGLCDCPDGSAPDPTTGECRCPPGRIWAADLGDDLECLTCEQARAEFDRLVADFRTKATTYNEQFADWGGCVEDCGTAGLPPQLCTSTIEGPCAGLRQALENNYAILADSLTPLELLLARMLQAGCTNTPVNVDLPDFGPPAGGGP